MKAFRILKTRLPWKVSVLGSASFISVNVPPSMGRFPEVAAGQGVKHPLLTTHVHSCTHDTGGKEKGGETQVEQFHIVGFARGNTKNS